MTSLVPADRIEAIVGIKRRPTTHFARADAAEQTVYILHSKECLDAFDDLRACPWSQALDQGIDERHWPKDETVVVRVRDGHLIPMPLPTKRAGGSR